MIQFSLKCDHDHRFDSWFQSADAFDKLQSKGMVTCSVCGSEKVEKALMAPRVSKEAAPLSAPASPAEQAMAELRKKITENSDYVGRDFVSEARRMHNGEAEARSIHGEARLDEARKLAEEGVPVMPLPFLPKSKAN
ncbi:DUF1178 family protein [Pseudooceanicola sp. C21-150M6]|uniref:DUF1178 family protein n=1 Tax=Pseudooceanicola sp. C21-150M6 TaxID=3434355 RepID=UPI003D7F8ECF